MRKYVRPLAAVAIALVALFMSTMGFALSAAASLSITEYYITTGNSSTNNPDGITTGPDGALWFTEPSSNNIARMTISGDVSYYHLGPCSIPGFNNLSCDPFDITTGPDGALWFTEPVSNAGNYIGRITTSGDVSTYPLPYNLTPHYITTGPDGALWFTGTAFSGGTGNTYKFIGRITTAGVVTTFTPPTSTGDNYAWTIAAGPDGALWFAEVNGNKIGRLSTSGEFTEYPLPTPNSQPINITSGSDGALWFTENNGSRVGRITTTGTITEYSLPNPNYFAHGIAAGPDGAMWFSEIDGNRIARITTPVLPAPSNLSASSPAQNPSLSWDAVVGSTSYNIYRNGTKVGSSTTATYTDNSAPEGTDTYYVTAVNSAGESSPSNSVSILVDRTPPTVSNVTLAQNPLATGSTTLVSATVADNLSGVAKAEYYIGKDPGQGNGTTMTISNGTATATVGPFSTAGIYTIYVRDQDSVGNWSQPVAVNADVYNPSAGYTAGHGFISPNGATSNPGDNLPAVSGPNVKATLDFTIKYASSTLATPTGMSTFTWGSGNCKKSNNPCFVVTADTSVNPNALSWLIVPGDNTATFQGIASVSLNGQTLGTNYVMRVNIIATTDTTPGHYELQVYQAGSNPDTSTPVYQASGDLTGGAVLVH